MKVNSQFNPRGLLKNRHVQTILPQFLKRKPKRHFRTELFKLSDGDALELQFIGDMRKGLVIVLHGIIASSVNHYTEFTIEAITELGLGCVFVRSRGTSDKTNRSPRFFNAGHTADLNEVIRHLHTRFSNIPLFAIGYSLGGAILTKWLAEHQENCQLTAGIAFSLPFDLGFCSHNFKDASGKFYHYFVLKKLRSRLMKNLKKHPDAIDLKRLKKIRTIPELDDFVTAPINGYRNAADYYEQGSPRKYLKHVKKPLLIVHSLDDPFMSPSIVPSEDELSEHVTLELSNHGGHLGFISNIGFGKVEYWAKQRIKTFLLQQKTPIEK